MVEVKIHKLNKAAELPNRMSTHAAGYDLYSCHQQNITLKKGEVKLIPTGIAIHCLRVMKHRSVHAAD